MASPTATGRLVAGRYRVLERLGSGGMASVYLAEDERLGRRVAVKRLHAGSPEDTAKRFAREARLGASLNHENIVTVYDTVADDDSVVIVMEHVDGESLADALRRGPIEPDRAVDVLRGVAAALGHAHQNGIVHRDVKPANILLSRDGAVKLVDLGIATAVEGTRITQAGSVMGTAAYMAPEQLDGREAGTPADVYALAAVAYEMLTGRPAYRGGSPVEVAHQVVTGPPPDLRGAWAAAPRQAAEAVARAMAFDPAERPPTPAAFVDDLEHGLRGAEQPTSPPTSVLPRSRRAPRPALPLIALVALVLTAVAVAIALTSGGDGGGSSDSATSADARREARAERRRARAERERARQQAAAQQTQEQPAPDAQPQPADPGAGAYSVPRPSGPSNDEGAALQAQGHRLLQSGEYDRAIPVLERSVESFPAGTTHLSYAYALFDLGSALRLAERPDDAIPVLEERLKIDNQRDVVQRELDAARSAAAG
jgi:serine/threonine protein kinase